MYNQRFGGDVSQFKRIEHKNGCRRKTPSSDKAHRVLTLSGVTSLIIAIDLPNLPSTMSDQPAQVATAADATIAGNTTPSAPVAAPATPAPVPAAPAQAQPVAAPAAETKAPAVGYPQLPAYALQYAPILWLHSEEKYWPGDPLEHLLHTAPQNKDGTKVEIPHDIFGKFQCLKLPGVNHPDVYLCLDVR